MTGNGAPANTGDSRATGRVFPELVGALLAILLVTYLAYFLNFSADLYYADWALIPGGTFTDTWIDLTFPWPFMKAPYFLLYKLSGTNIAAFHIAMGALNGLQAFLIYLICIDLFRRGAGLFGVVIALIFLVYPTVYTQMHVTRLHMNSALFLALLHAYCLLRFAHGGHAILMALSLFFLAVSLGIYETQTGGVCLWAMIVFLTAQDRTLGRRLAILSPVVLVGVFALWRWYVFDDEGGKDSFLAMLMVSPSQLYARALDGYAITLLDGWTTTIKELMPAISSEMQAAVLLICGLLILSWTSSRIAEHTPRRASHSRTPLEPLDARRRVLQPYALCCVIGLLFICAGYLPVINRYEPTLYAALSRVNSLAAIGGAVFWASALMCGALAFARAKDRTAYAFVATAVPLILLGIATQSAVQRNAKIAWKEQRSIYRAMFAMAPNFADGSAIILVLRGYQDRDPAVHWQRPPMDGFWMVSHAIRLFYENPTLTADIVFPDYETRSEARLTPQGIINSLTGALTPYARSVFFEHDPESNELRRLEDLPAELVEGASAPIRLPADRVLPGQASDFPWRRLVAE